MTNTSIPAKFKLGHQTIEVIKNPDRYMRKNENGDYNIGRWRGLEGEIEVCTGLKPEIAYGTFIHEVIEAISDTYDLNFNHQTITTLAASLCQVLTTAEYDEC